MLFTKWIDSKSNFIFNYYFVMNHFKNSKFLIDWLFTVTVTKTTVPV